MRRVGFPPSSSITQMSSSAARSLENAIFIPSGDHSGKASKPSTGVSRRLVRTVVVHHPDVLEAVLGVRGVGDLRAVGRPRWPRLLHVRRGGKARDVAAVGVHREDVAVAELAAGAPHVGQARAFGVPVGHRLIPVRGIGEPGRPRDPGEHHPDVDLALRGPAERDVAVAAREGCARGGRGRQRQSGHDGDPGDPCSKPHPSPPGRSVSSIEDSTNRRSALFLVAIRRGLRHHVSTRGRRWSSLHEQLETLEVIGC